MVQYIFTLCHSAAAAAAVLATFNMEAPVGKTVLARPLSEVLVVGTSPLAYKLARREG